MDTASFCKAVRPTIKTKITWKINDFKHKVKAFVTGKALSIIRWATKDSRYRHHAKVEFIAAGYVPVGDTQEDGPNKWIQENILDLLSVLALQGHSGGSIGYCVNAFKKLAMFDPLTPINGTEDEWKESISHDETFQNKRLSAVFKEGVDGRPYYLDAIVWRNESGSAYTGGALDSKGNTIKSRQFIKLPFMPKTFYVDVIEKEIAPDDLEFHIKDESQLDEVFEYYERW